MNSNTKSYQIIQLIKLSIPMLISSLSNTLMNSIDTIMANQAGTLELAGVALGSSLWYPVILFFTGILMSLTPILSTYYGAKEYKKMPTTLHQGLYISLFSSIIVIIILNNTLPFLLLFNIDYDIAYIASEYLYFLSFGVPAFFLYYLLKSLTEGCSHTQPAMFISFIGLLLNIPLNYVFIFGLGSIPAYGGAGCGLSTSIILWIMAILLFSYLIFSKKYHHFKLLQHFSKPQKNILKLILSKGLPVAIGIFCEVSLFFSAAILIAPLGVVPLAAHQIANNISSIIFIIPLSIGMAVSIRVGYYIGTKEINLAKLSVKSGIYLATSLALITALITVFFRQNILSIYTQDQDVIAIAMTILLFCAIYQIADAIQVINVFALRGFKDTTPVIIISLISFWLMGIAGGYILSYTHWITEPLGVFGFWIGFILALFTAAILFNIRLQQIYKKYQHQ